MAGLWCDDFMAYYNTAQMLDGVYAENDGTGVFDISTANPPRAGASHLRCPKASFTASGNILRRIFGAAKVTAGVAYRLYLPNLPSSEDLQVAIGLFVFVDASNGPQVQILLGTDGSLIVYRGGELNWPGVGGGAPTLLGRSVPCVTAKAYNHIEAKVVIDGVAGAIEVRVNGVTKFNFSGNTKGTANTETSQITIQGPGWNAGVATMDVCDLHAWDTIPGQGPVDFVGNVGCLARQLIADTAIADFALSTGSVGYTLLIDDDDTTYIEADTVGLKSAFLAAPLPAGTTGIVYQQLMFRALKTDAGDCDINVSFITPQVSGWDETLTGDQPLTTAETWRWGIVGLDPGTEAPWTYSGVSASFAAVSRTL